MRSWNELSMAEKADVMKLAIDGGVYDLDSIRSGYNEYAKGGKIHIDPSKKGTFTAAASKHGKSVQQFASQVLAHPENYSPAMRKKANFARNAAKWKHALGGPLQESDDYPEGYWENRREHSEVRPQYKRTKKDDEYWEEKNRRNAQTAEELNRRKDVVMSALSDTANSVPFTGSEVTEAAEAQRQEKLDKAHELKMGLDATMTAAELLAAGYGVTRGLTHLNRYIARQATQSTGQAISRDVMMNLAKWNRRVTRIDKPQVLMNGIGGTADAYQLYTADNNFDAWENGLETGANAAGVVGGMNWFRNLPYLRRIGGDKIDAVLDGLGYGAAGWDVVKNIPPLSWALDNIRTQSKESKALGGNLFYPGGEITYGQPYYSYDENGKKIDDTLNYNATLPEITITPDSKKSPAERAVLERERRRNHDAYYGRGTYNAKVDREQTELEKIASQKAWENSIEKQALDYAQAAASGIGIGADVVSGLPIYSSLKGARVLSEAETPMDYAEGALWLAPIAGVAGREAWNTGKQVAGKVAEAARPIIENEGVAVVNPFTGDINWIGKGLGSYIEVSPTADGWLGVDYINSTRSGTGRKLYDAAIEEAHKRGLKGVKSGESLHSAPKTYNIWEHYPDKVHLGDYGSHGNSSMIDAAMTTKVNSPEELIEATKQGINAAVMKKAPVYGLTNPSGDVPLLSLSKESFPNITAEQENLIKDVLSKFTSNGETTGIKAMSISDREAGYNRMKEFINSPEYKERLKAAGMEDYGDYMVGLIEKRLNGKNFFPAWRADSILGKNYRGLSEVDPTDIDYGVTVRSDLQGNDFLQTFDHELAHWSTENTSPSFWKDLKESISHNKTSNLKLQKLMRYNDKIAPTKTMEEYLNTQNPNMSKKELAEAKRKFRYVSSGQERRARAYSMIQEAKRRGISTDELVDMYTIEDELLGEAPKQLLELNMVYTPENLKKYLKGFLSITTPTTLGINIAANE